MTAVSATTNNAASAATTATSSTTGSSSSGTSSSSALSSLSGNLNDFLKLLMVQLQNQDPTSPMDTNQFTSELVQYASVEQQINTNTNLQTLITATQSNTVLQSSSLVGKQVDVTSDHLALQDGAASVHFNATAPGTATVTVTNDVGNVLYHHTISTQAGSNDWSWDGKSDRGAQLPDGSYKVAVTDTTGTALPTTVSGTVTGLKRTSAGVDVALGAMTANVNDVQSINSRN